MRYDRVCSKCGKSFKTCYEKLEHPICYDCALMEVTRGNPPEEGDFTTARIRSGEMTDEEASWLRQDLLSVDHSDVPPDADGFDPDWWYDED